MNKEIIPIIDIEKELMVIHYQNGTSSFKPKEEMIRLTNGAFIMGLKGKLSLTMNLTPYEVTADTLLTIIPHNIVQGQSLSSDFEGYVVFFTPSFAADINLLRSHLPFMTEMRYNPLVQLTQDESQLFTNFCQFFHSIEDNELINSSPEVRKGMLTSLLYTLGALYKRQIPQSASEKQSRANIIFKKFLALLVENYTRERSVAFYANELCITPKYLGTICREVSSKLATDIIASAVILDAKAKLHSSDLTVQEISNTLNFPNASFFGRYFKRHTGLSPMQYREQI